MSNTLSRRSRLNFEQSVKRNVIESEKCSHLQTVTESEKGSEENERRGLPRWQENNKDRAIGR